MYLTIYLIGLIIAFYLVSKRLASKNDDVEFSGNIICYLFTFLSWIAVFILLFTSKNGNLRKV